MTKTCYMDCTSDVVLQNYCGKPYIASQPRLHVFHLPKYSPDWNPDEKVWNHLKLKGHQAKSKDELKILTQKKLERMAHNPSLLRGIFFRCCVADFFG
jgi:hypothetical protein